MLFILKLIIWWKFVFLFVWIVLIILLVGLDNILFLFWNLWVFVKLLFDCININLIKLIFGELLLFKIFFFCFLLFFDFFNKKLWNWFIYCCKIGDK